MHSYARRLLTMDEVMGVPRGRRLSLRRGVQQSRRFDPRRENELPSRSTLQREVGGMTVPGNNSSLYRGVSHTDVAQSSRQRGTDRRHRGW